MSEYAAGRGNTWRQVMQRAARELLPRRGRRSRWSLVVPVIALAAGLLFTTSATNAVGAAPLREDRQLELSDLIGERQARVAEAEAVIAPLEAEVAALTAALAGADTPVLQEQQRATGFRDAAGFSALRGPGITIQLDDAFRVDGVRPPGAEADDLLVHQDDVQAVVNALWAGGAEAMAIMGERIVTTSAVLCVGPVLLLHGRPFSPPYEITAIGDPGTLRDALAASPGVQLYLEAADAYGLGYRETVEEDVTVPAYEGTSTLRSGRVPR